MARSADAYAAGGGSWSPNDQSGDGLVALPPQRIGAAPDRGLATSCDGRRQPEHRRISFVAVIVVGAITLRWAQHDYRVRRKEAVLDVVLEMRTLDSEQWVAAGRRLPSTWLPTWAGSFVMQRPT
jgi:hypothetical protein